MRPRRIGLLIALLVVLGLLGAWLRELRGLSRLDRVLFDRDVSGDCAVVLTGGPHRVREGFDLLAQGRVGRLIVSGVHPSVRLNEIAPFLPFYGPIEPNRIVLERRSQTTFGNARQSRALVESLGCRRVVLITSQVHMPRAEKMFRSELPVETELVLRPVAPSWAESDWTDLGLEALKTTFYGVWAF